VLFKLRGGFSLVELLVTLGIMSLLMSILVPALAKVRLQAQTLLGLSNQRQIVSAVNLYSMDEDHRYPESVATIGFGSRWHWQSPTMLTGYKRRSPGLHRSVSAYLGEYIQDASIMFCPKSPEKYKYLQQAWDAGDEWDHPETDPVPDPVFGSYCLYWNYIGYLDEESTFQGPKFLSGGRGQSELLVSDYFGYDHWRSPNSYGSCEPMRGARIASGTDVSSDYWSFYTCAGNTEADKLGIELAGGYADGHVEKYSPSDVIAIQVAITSNGSVPYPKGMGAGMLYLPANAAR